LNKTKAYLNEVVTIRDDIMHLKQTAEEADDMENVVAENEILKAKISDMETKVNTLSRDESEFQDIRSKEKQ
jgi:cell division protein FtsB